jgi:hypothetical protein
MKSSVRAQTKLNSNEIRSKKQKAMQPHSTDRQASSKVRVRNLESYVQMAQAMMRASFNASTISAMIVMKTPIIK